MSVCILPGLLIPRLANAHAVRASDAGRAAVLAAVRRRGADGECRMRAVCSINSRCWPDGSPRCSCCWRLSSGRRRARAARRLRRSSGTTATSASHPFSDPPWRPWSADRCAITCARIRCASTSSPPFRCWRSHLHRRRRGDPLHYFVRALGAFAVVGFLGTAVMSTNQFGFDCSGFPPLFPAARASRRASCAPAVTRRCSWAAVCCRLRWCSGCSSRRFRSMRAWRRCCWRSGVGRAVPVQCAGDLDLAAGAAAHGFRNHFRQPTLAGRQHAAHWRHTGDASSASLLLDKVAGPATVLRLLVGGDAGGGCWPIAFIFFPCGAERSFSSAARERLLNTHRRTELTDDSSHRNRPT